MTPGQRKIDEAMALAHAGKPLEARRVLEQYTRARPGDAAARLALGLLLCSGGPAELEASLAHFEAAANASDEPHEAWFHQAQAMTMLDRPLASLGVCERALTRYRDDAMFIFLRGQARLAAGMSDGALGDLRHAAEMLDSADAWRTYANATLYAGSASAESQRDAFVRLGRLIEHDVGARTTLRPRVRRPKEPIRLALVSPDFREHPVGWFIETLIRELDASRIEVTCLNAAPIRDTATERIAQRVHAMDDVSGLSDDALCAMAQLRGFDVALDLAGHSAGSRLGAFARGLAPVQGTYLGHPVTTGVSAMDVRLVDSITDPAGSEHLCVERLVRLDPIFIAFGPPRDAPMAGPAPGPASRGASEPIVFGSFNAVTKISEACVALWSRVLREVAGSTLVLKGATLAEPALREHVRKRFVAHGVDAARVRVLSPTRTTREHLEAYRQIDIALDTFPYHGTTTTCEAMWMGVPVVTRVGDRHASRVGASILHATGVGAASLGALVAPDDDAFVRIAAGLARDRSGLAGWRDTEGLRALMARSAVCDARGLAERFTAALESLVAEGAAHA